MHQKNELIDYIAIEENQAYLKRLAFMIKVTYFIMFICIISFVIGAYYLIVSIQKSIESNISIELKTIWWQILICFLSFGIFIGIAYLQAFWKKKAIDSYASKRTTIKEAKYKPMEINSKPAKKGVSSGENELEITDAKIEIKFCRHCGAKIPKNTTGNCPVCGKPI